ncbi:MAG: hypothetical protein KC503_37485 [Myxococcales bacterium]|nr:hypothetical protein [Myxococcales bacterium]
MHCTDVIVDVLAMWAPQPAPVRHLVRVAELCGFTENAARVAVRRLVVAGKLEAQTTDDRAGYRLSRDAAAFNQHVRRAVSRPRTRPWSGAWLQVLMSLPDRQRKRRAAMQRALSVLRLRSPYRGVWMRPDNLDVNQHDVVMQLGEAGGDGERPHVLAARFFDPARERALAADLFELETTAEEQRRALTVVERARDELLTLPLGDAVAASIGLGRAAIGVLFRDPLLPAALLPTDWAADALRHGFAATSALAAELWRRWAEAEGDRSGIDTARLRQIFDEVTVRASLPELWEAPALAYEMPSRAAP